MVLGEKSDFFPKINLNFNQAESLFKDKILNVLYA